MTHVYRWDLDKTYLATEFDTLRALVRTARERADEKRNVPGTATLMRELKSGPDGASNRIYIISGSPRQMRRVLEEKLRLDGVDVDGLTLKPNLANVLRFRFRALRDQLGYKLPALLESRAVVGPEPLETCFGDDAEVDGVVYRLFSDVCARRVEGKALDTMLKGAHVYKDQRERIHQALRGIPEHDPLERVLIHLDTRSPTRRFLPLGPRVATTFNTFQAALVLHQDGRLSTEGVVHVAGDMVGDYGYTRLRLDRSLADSVRRGIVTSESAAPVAAALGLAPPPSLRMPPPRETRVVYPAVLRVALA